MKIEKINEHQIRCTLTHEDLALRDIKISELAYGSDKTKKLIRDMMQKAAYEFGFEAEDIPLMIEAVPLNSECVVLVITKVEDPEELDTRFAKFAPSVHEDLWEDEDLDSLDLFSDASSSKFSNESTHSSFPFSPESISDSAKKGNLEPTKENASFVSHVLISFPEMATVMKLSEIISSYYDEHNALYKDPATNEYLLDMQKGSLADAEFKKICNIATEYGKPITHLGASHAYLNEHCEIIIKNQAIQKLATL